MSPRMIVVAGPPGSGKSTAFPVAESGVDFMNIDDVAATLNYDSYLNIPPEIRAEANRRCEMFIADHIRDKRSFAVETTLRTTITFEQARAARTNGFETHITYVATDDVSINIERIAARAAHGGHSAAAATIRGTYAASLNHFPQTIREFDAVVAFDNSTFAQDPQIALVSERGRIIYLMENPPTWISERFRESS